MRAGIATVHRRACRPATAQARKPLGRWFVGPGAGALPRETVTRLSGAALVAGGALCIAGGPLHPIVAGHGHSVEALTSPGTPIAQSLLGVGTVALILGLPGMYSWLRPRIGLVGFLGTVAYFVGNIVTAAGHLTVELFVAYPYANDPATAHLVAADDTMLGTTAFALFNNLGGLAMLAGMGMLGASLLRNRAVPRWIAWLTLAGMVGFFLPLPAVWGFSGFLYEAPRGIAVAALGALMIRRPHGLRRWFRRG